MGPKVEKIKGHHGEGQQDQVPPGGKASSEKVSERTSETSKNLREVHW